MAEAIGVVAAAVQFAEIGVKILTLISKIKGFSEKCQRLQSHVSQILAITTTIQSIHTNSATNPLSQELESVLLECSKQGRLMAELLDHIIASPNNSIISRKWKTVLGMMKEKQLEEICDYLERHKTFLILYITNTNRILLERLTKNIEDEMAGHCDRLKVCSCWSHLTSPRIKEDSANRVSQSEISRFSLRSSRTSEALDPMPFSHNFPVYPEPNRLTGRKACSCHSQIHNGRWMIIHASLAISIKLINHHSSCNTNAGSRQMSLKIRVSNNAQFRASILLHSNWTVSISQSINIRPTIDFRRSPAFRLFLDDFASYDSSGSCSFMPIKDDTQYVQRVTFIQQRLLTLVGEGRVSPLDVNQYGQTLMGAALSFLEHPAATVSRRNPAPTKDLIRFLINIGVPLNVQGCYESSPLWRIADLERLFQHEIEGLSLSLEYSYTGGELGDNNTRHFSVNSIICPPSPAWINSFLRAFPGISKEFMCSEALCTIISKSSERLQQLVDSKRNVQCRTIWGQTMLHLSASWPEGLKILILAGLPVDYFDDNGRPPLYFAVGAQCLQGVDVFLQFGCALIFKVEGECSWTHFVLWDVFETLRSIQSLIIKELGTRLNWLQNLEAKELNQHEFESIARQTFGPYTLGVLAFPKRKLPGFVMSHSKKFCREHGFTGHANFFYGGLKYLKPSPWLASDDMLWTMKTRKDDIEQRTLSLFDQLWFAGFSDLDGYNSDGYTLLLICSLQGKLNGVLWILHRLQSPPNSIRNCGANAMHCIAQYLGYHGEKDWSADQISLVLRQLQLRGVDALAQCCSSCFCLLDGNTPTAMWCRGLCQTSIQGMQRHDFFKSSLKSWEATAENSDLTVENIYQQLVLCETFNRLGLTHTCSKWDKQRSNEPHLVHLCYDSTVDQECIEDIYEIHDEEEDLISQLKHWQCQYEIELAAFNGSVVEFFDIWWERLPHFESKCPFPPQPKSSEVQSIAWEVEMETNAE